MPGHRVVVTGMGVLAPNGNNLREYWESLRAGKSGIGTITKFDTTGFSVDIAGEISNFNPEDHLDPKEIRRLDPFSIYGLVATREALDQAGLDLTRLAKHRVGVILGTGVGGIQTLQEQSEILIHKGPRRISPFFVPMMIANIAAGQISIKWGFTGPSYVVTSACASATDALGDAVRLIREGLADVVISGGTEAAVNPLPISGFANMKALTTDYESPQTASRPFDLNRNGFVMGEGAGILVLESEQHARSRNARILCELAGYGVTNDAFHITQPAPGGSGAVAAMQMALLDAGCAPTDIDYINAHGTSTVHNDRTETAAVKTLFGDHAYQLKISSTKSMTGHLLGASGAVEAIASILALENNCLPPTINYQTPDPECDLDYVPNQAVSTPVNTVLSNTFGFGGHNAVILIKRWTA